MRLALHHFLRQTPTPPSHFYRDASTVSSSGTTPHSLFKDKEAGLTCVAVCKLTLEGETSYQGLNRHWPRNPPRPLGQAPSSGLAALALHSARLLWHAASRHVPHMCSARLLFCSTHLDSWHCTIFYTRTLLPITRLQRSKNCFKFWHHTAQPLF